MTAAAAWGALFSSSESEDDRVGCHGCGEMVGDRCGAGGVGTVHYSSFMLAFGIRWVVFPRDLLTVPPNHPAHCCFLCFRLGGITAVFSRSVPSAVASDWHPLIYFITDSTMSPVSCKYFYVKAYPNEIFQAGVTLRRGAVLACVPVLTSAISKPPHLPGSKTCIMRPPIHQARR